MRRVCALVVVVFLLGFVSIPALAQNTKPDAAVARLGVLGKVADVENRILFNRLQSDLSNTYKLVSQQAYTQAEELAFKELEAEQRAEEQCVREIKEILQMDQLILFHLIQYWSGAI